MRNFDDGVAGDPNRDTPWRKNDAGGVTLEGEIVGDSIHVAPPEPEPVWGANAAGLGRKLLIAFAVIASLVILVPLMLAFMVVVLLMALVGRLLLGRKVTVARWTHPWSKPWTKPWNGMRG